MDKVYNRQSFWYVKGWPILGMELLKNATYKSKKRNFNSGNIITQKSQVFKSRDSGGHSVFLCRLKTLQKVGLVLHELSMSRDPILGPPQTLLVHIFVHYDDSLLHLTPSWWRLLSYRNQSIYLLCKSLDWFLYDNGLVMKELKQIRLYQQL